MRPVPARSLPTDVSEHKRRKSGDVHRRKTCSPVVVNSSDTFVVTYKDGHKEDLTVIFASVRHKVEEVRKLGTEIHHLFPRIKAFGAQKDAEQKAETDWLKAFSEGAERMRGVKL